MIFRNFVDGEWRDGIATIENINPSDLDDVIGIYAQADAQQTRHAITAAKTAFRSWSTTTCQAR